MLLLLNSFQFILLSNFEKNLKIILPIRKLLYKRILMNKKVPFFVFVLHVITRTKPSIQSCYTSQNIVPFILFLFAILLALNLMGQLAS